MMQNSLERLLEGMAASLHTTVLPVVDDDFARGQVRACIELLGNLATRVEWRCDQLAEVVEHARAALVPAAQDGPAVRTFLEAPAPVGQAALLEARRAALAAVAEAQAWAARVDDAEASAALDAFVRWHLDAELSRLRSASFGRPN
jgi:hypothetical protein